MSAPSSRSLPLSCSRLKQPQRVRREGTGVGGVFITKEERGGQPRFVQSPPPGGGAGGGPGRLTLHRVWPSPSQRRTQDWTPVRSAGTPSAHWVKSTTDSGSESELVEASFSDETWESSYSTLITQSRPSALRILHGSLFRTRVGATYVLFDSSIPTESGIL